MLLPGCEAYEAAAFIDVFGWDRVCGSRNCNLQSCGFTAEVRTAFGQCLRPDLNLSEQSIDAEQFAALAIPGGFPRFGYGAAVRLPETRALLCDFAARKKPLAAVCTGTLALAAAGLLQGKTATTYPIAEGYFQQQLLEAGARFSSERFVIDEHIITAQNPAKAIDTALYLLQQLTDEENASHIRSIMGF